MHIGCAQGKSIGHLKIITSEITVFVFIAHKKRLVFIIWIFKECCSAVMLPAPHKEQNPQTRRVSHSHKEHKFCRKK